MGEFIHVGCWAFALGVVTALHPCPLATIAATAGLFESIGRAFFRLLAFCLGIVFAFTLLGSLVSYGAGFIPGISHTVPLVFRPFAGPVLILVGMAQAGMIGIPVRWTVFKRRPWPAGGTVGCFLGGMLLALAFCPATAGVFFALLIPASLSSGYTLGPAICYGLGYALIPLVMMVVLRGGYTKFKRLGSGRYSRSWGRWIAGVTLTVGIIITIRYTFMTV